MKNYSRYQRATGVEDAFKAIGAFTTMGYHLEANQI